MNVTVTPIEVQNFIMHTTIMVSMFSGLAVAGLIGGFGLFLVAVMETNWVKTFFAFALILIGVICGIGALKLNKDLDDPIKTIATIKMNKMKETKPAKPSKIPTQPVNVNTETWTVTPINPINPIKE